MTNVTPTNPKLISIIMATFNCGQKVENTLNSIFAQNPDLFELIILDSISNDGTLEYLKKYEDKITLVSEKDSGIYYAFNKGIELATGKYLYFIGAGDILNDGILNEIKDFLPTDEPSLIYGKCKFSDREKFYNEEFTANSFITNCLCQQGIFYHRDIFQIVGKYELRYKVFADWFLNINCFLSDKINKKFIDYAIATYEGGGISSNINNDPIFKKEFPLFVKKEFGWIRSKICWIYLKDPEVFYDITHGNFIYLAVHLIYKYPILRKSASLVNGFFKFFKRRKISSLKETTVE